MQPIGYIQTPFREKFGVPRQSGMVSAPGTIKLNATPGFVEAVRGLEAFSHVWVLFLFHKTGAEWKPTISLPRIDPPHEAGVFASRSPHRPNPIGMSALKLERIEFPSDGIEIHVSGVDILDGTPVLDIKPYVAYTDSLPDADSAWADGKIPRYPVVFSETSLADLATLAGDTPPSPGLIEQMLQWDPRPASQRRAWPVTDAQSDGKPFAFRVQGIDVKWEIRQGTIHVTAIVAG